MRRLVLLVACLALAMPVSLAAAKHAPVNHVFGDVTREFPGSTAQITFDVTGDAFSTAASGSFHFQVFGGLEHEFTGSVDCLMVVGNTAYMSGDVTASNFVPAGTPFWVSARDTSPDGKADAVSTINLGLIVPGGSPVPCTEVVEPPDHVITSGNIVIEQCDWITGSGKCKHKPEDTR